MSGIGELAGLETRSKAVSMLMAGQKAEEVAKAFGFSVRTIYYRLKKT